MNRGEGVEARGHLGGHERGRAALGEPFAVDVEERARREDRASGLTARPAVARTRASIASVIGVVSEPLLFPSTWVGVITTSWPRLAVWKMPAKDWLIVSVST